MTYTIVPVFEKGEPGPPEGGRGTYDAVVALGIPGREIILVDVDFSEAVSSGDSQILSTGGEAQLYLEGLDQYSTVKLVPNTQGRMAQIRLSVEALNFGDAERFTHDLVMPIISRMAFETDTALDVRTIHLTERSTGIQTISGRVFGKTARLDTIEGMITPELRPYLASYREGLNLNSETYQALAFWKVIEGVTTFNTSRIRRTQSGTRTAVPDPEEHRFPAASEDIPDPDQWTALCFAPYLGMTFKEVKEILQIPIRHAVAHLVPGLDTRSVDVFDDLQTCRTAVPVLRFMARTLIQCEIDALEFVAPRPMEPKSDDH
jgi:hypothetical protein